MGSQPWTYSFLWFAKFRHKVEALFHCSCEAVICCSSCSSNLPQGTSQLIFAQAIIGRYVQVKLGDDDLADFVFVAFGSFLYLARNFERLPCAIIGTM